MIKRIGLGTIAFDNMPAVEGCAAVVGKKESEGPLGALFDKVIYDSRDGAETFEAAESRMQHAAAQCAMENGEGDAARGGCGLRVRRRFAEPVRRLQLWLDGFRHPLSRAVRRLLHHGADALDGRCDGVLRCGGARAVRYVLAFLRGGAAVSLSDGIRLGAHADRPVDGHRRRRLCAWQQRQSSENPRRHHRQNQRLQHHRRQ